MNEEAMTPDKEQVVEPLNADEEAIARRTHRPTSRTEPFIWVESGEKDERVETSCARCEEEWPCGASRLLATLDAARTASVAGLDERVAEAIYDAMRENDPEGRDHPWVPGGNSRKQEEARRRARAALNSAPSIEQEPGETLERIDALRTAIDAAVDELNAAWAAPTAGAIGAAVTALQSARTADDIAQGRDWPPVVARLARHGLTLALREQEPGETLRAADIRAMFGDTVIAVEDVAGFFVTDPGDHVRPMTTIEDRIWRALEADSNPQETEPTGDITQRRYCVHGVRDTEECPECGYAFVEADPQETER